MIFKRKGNVYERIFNVPQSSKKQIDMEMQLYNYKAWTSRSLYYLSRMYVEQLKEGDSYTELKKCIHVGILDFVLFEDIPGFYSKFNIREDNTGVLYTDDLEFYVIELPKLARYNNPRDEVLNWAKFFNSNTKEEFEVSAADNIYIEKAYENLQVMSMEEQKRLEYEYRQKVLRDHHSFMKAALEEGMEEGMKKGMKKGMEKGMKKGMEEGMENTILNALRGGSSPEEISRVLHMPIEKILSVQAKMLEKV